MFPCKLLITCQCRQFLSELMVIFLFISDSDLHLINVFRVEFAFSVTFFFLLDNDSLSNSSCSVILLIFGIYPEVPASKSYSSFSLKE